MKGRVFVSLTVIANNSKSNLHVHLTCLNVKRYFCFNFFKFKENEKLTMSFNKRKTTFDVFALYGENEASLNYYIVEFLYKQPFYLNSLQNTICIWGYKISLRISCCIDRRPNALHDKNSRKKSNPTKIKWYCPFRKQNCCECLLFFISFISCK